MATVKYVVTDYWDDKHTHRPYTNLLRRSDNDTNIGFSEALEAAIDEAEAVDGDEIEIHIVKTGRRPFGDHRVRLVAPHEYARETAEAREQRRRAR